MCKEICCSLSARRVRARLSEACIVPGSSLTGCACRTLLHGAAARRARSPWFCTATAPASVSTDERAAPPQAGACRGRRARPCRAESGQVRARELPPFAHTQRPGPYAERAALAPAGGGRRAGCRHAEGGCAHARCAQGAGLCGAAGPGAGRAGRARLGGDRRDAQPLRCRAASSRPWAQGGRARYSRPLAARQRAAGGPGARCTRRTLPPTAGGSGCCPARARRSSSSAPSSRARSSMCLRRPVASSRCRCTAGTGRSCGSAVRAACAWSPCAASQPCACTLAHAGTQLRPPRRPVQLQG